MRKEIIKKAFEYLRSIGEAHIQQDVADRLGTNKTNISRAFNGDEKYLTKSFLQRFNETYNNVFNYNWLLTGEGEMLNNIPKIELQQVSTEENIGEFFTENTNGARFYDLGNGKYRMITKLVPFCAYGRFANEADTLEPDKEDWENESFEVSKIVHGNYLSFEVKGESMDDGTRQSFEAGDRVLVRELNRIHWTDRLRYNDYPYWVVVFNSSVLIKQMINQDVESGIITFHSLNPSPEYSDFTLHINEIRKLYYVVQKKPKTINY